MEKIKSIVVIPNKDKPEAEKMAEIIKGWLSLKPGYKVYTTLSRNVLEKTSVVVGIGGDGWLLHIAREVFRRDKEIPIVGINYGFRGYLCRIQPNEAKEKIERILQGHFEKEERTRIQAEIRKIENDELVEVIDALNEIVIGGISKTVSLAVTITDGEKVIVKNDPNRGDGVIFATNTGKTGYSKNAGGIIDGLNEEKFVVTANNPVSDDWNESWLTREKSVVFSTKTIFEIRSRVNKKLNLPYAIGDGQRDRRLKSDEYVIIKKSPRKTLFVKFKNLEQ
jgi:NAD+ kinase